LGIIVNNQNQIELQILNAGAELDPDPDPAPAQNIRQILNGINNDNLAPPPVQAQNIPVPNLVPAPDLNPIPAPENPNRDYGLLEMKNQGGKVETFADDNTAMGQKTQPAVMSIQNTLERFADISGLKCNVDKSMIMLTGDNAPVPDYITGSGFKVVDRFSK
jgi:hypothetical protein